jgi:hypothetical protein
MKTAQSLFAAALSLLLVALTSPLDRSVAQTALSTSTAAAKGGHHGAPGPILGAGLPALAVIGIGYGVYWLRKRRHRRTDV